MYETTSTSSPAAQNARSSAVPYDVVTSSCCATPRALSSGGREAKDVGTAVGSGLPARSVEGQHQQAPQPLAQRELRDQPLEVRHERVVLTELQLGVGELFAGNDAKLLEAVGGLRRERLVRDVEQRLTAPEAERL